MIVVFFKICVNQLLNLSRFERLDPSSEARKSIKVTPPK